jgi:hypothetical protein
MSEHKIGRRKFLWLGISRPVSLPLLFIIGCDSEQQKTIVNSHALNPEESLRKLLLLLGPWTPSEKEQGEDFVRRFLASEHAGTYIPESSGLLKSLSSRFPADSMAVNQINLRKLPATERELLTNLTRQLYSFVEIRFYVSGEPPWGECQPDRTRYTRVPKSDSI